MKLKDILLVLSCVFCLQFVQAQNTDVPAVAAITPAPAAAPAFMPTSYLGINIGRAFAFAGYKTTGYATGGLTASCSGGYTINNTNYGIAFKIDYANNPVDSLGIQSALQSQIISETHNTSLTCRMTSTGYWNYYALFAGLYYTYPYHKLSVDFRAMLGVMYATSPELDLQIMDSSKVEARGSEPSSSALAPAFCIGLGVRYIVTEGFAIIGGFDFVYANPNFDVFAVAAGQSAGGVVQTTGAIGTASQVYMVGNLSIGLAWVPPMKKKK